MTYFWLKAAHIIFVIFWMAGLFMLPRFFVYHQEDASGELSNSVWVARERKLLRIILNPSMIIVWVLGITLVIAQPLWLQQGWLHAKLLLVLALSGYHGYLVGYAKKLAGGVARLSGKKLRLLNEAPGIAAALIVILVVVKPF